MPTTTPAQALPIPILADIANVPLHVQNLAQALEVKLVMVFASAAARTTAVPSPTAGMLSYRTDGKVYEFYSANAAAWVSLYSMQVGASTGTITTAIQSVNVAVTFPTAFVAAPAVFCMSNTTANNISVNVIAKSTTGFTARIYTTPATNPGVNVAVPFDWVAFGAF